MTVCVSIKVYDCIVFAADSATSLSGVLPNGEASIQNVWNHGIKVFNLHKQLPISAMTCGLGHFGSASISSLTKDLRVELMGNDSKKCIDPKSYSIAEVTDKAHTFLSNRYNAIQPPPAAPHSFEFFIGGYGSNGCSGEIKKIVFSNGDVGEPEIVASQDDSCYLSWAGQPAAINRLVIGYDTGVLAVLSDAGIPDDALTELSQRMNERVTTPLLHAAMPIVDAINLAEFLVDVTKRYFAFLPGADIVGGETEIATVTKHEGFKWIRRKHYYPQSLNLRDTDHV